MISFRKIEYRNILSSGNDWSEIKLDTSGKTLIMGKNGHGKSLILDAIVFALYGKPFRKINKSQLINTRNKGGLEVIIEFDANGHHYRIHRGIKPNIFTIYIDGKEQNQDAAVRDQQAYLEDDILGMNMKAFTQVVILGSATYTPFMELTAAQRRAIVEDFLDLSIISEMGKEVKSRFDENKSDIQGVNHTIDKLQVQLDAIEKNRKEVERLIAERNEEFDGMVSDLNIKLEKENRELGDIRLSAPTQEALELVAKIDDLRKNKRELEDGLNRGKDRIAENDKLVKFYEHNDTCPTCAQDIDDNFSKNLIDKKQSNTKIITGGLHIVKNKIRELDDEIKNAESIKQKAVEVRGNINFKKSIIADIESQIKSIETRRNKAKTETPRPSEIGDPDEVKFALKAKFTEQQILIDEKEILETATKMLRDGGIKAAIVKKYIGPMNELIQGYLNELGLGVTFSIDETFQETITTPNFDTYSYASFSEGEKLRIDLALLFTWRKIAQMRSATSTNLLILDEIMDSSLDDSGTEDFLRIINRLTDDASVFIISHKGDDVIEKFQNVIRVVKKKGFSSLETSLDKPI